MSHKQLTEIFLPSFPDVIGESSLFEVFWIVRASRTMANYFRRITLVCLRSVLLFFRRALACRLPCSAPVVPWRIAGKSGSFIPDVHGLRYFSGLPGSSVLSCYSNNKSVLSASSRVTLRLPEPLQPLVMLPSKNAVAMS